MDVEGSRKLKAGLGTARRRSDFSIQQDRDPQKPVM